MSDMYVCFLGIKDEGVGLGASSLLRKFFVKLDILKLLLNQFGTEAELHGPQSSASKKLMPYATCICYCHLTSNFHERRYYG